MSDSPGTDETQPRPSHEVQPVRADTQPDMSRAQARQGGGCGCWLPALLTLFVVVVLVIVGLFLPPVDLWNRLFGTQYAVLSSDANATANSGLTLSVDPADSGTDFGVAIDAMPMNTFLNGSGDADWLAAARAANPPYLALESQVYSIMTRGSAPDTVTLNLQNPATASSPELLSVYGWDSARGTWRFLPSRRGENGEFIVTAEEIPQQVALFQVAPPQQPTVLVTVDVVQTLTSDVGQLATIVAPAGLQPTLEGALTGSLAAGFDSTSGYLVAPAIRNFSDPRALDTDTINTILGNATLRRAHVDQLAGFASRNFDGLVIDYREVSPDHRDEYAAFIRELGTALDNLGLFLAVVVPEPVIVDGTWDTGAYDWRAIGQAADLLQVDLQPDPQAFSPGINQPVEAMMRWSVGEVDRRKLLLGLSARSVREVAGNFTPVGYAEALSGLGDVVVETEMTDADTVLPGTLLTAQLDGFQAVTDTNMQVHTPYIEYHNEADETVSTVWLTTGDALRFRMDSTLPLALGGVAINDLLANDLAADLLPAILSYKLQTPSTPGEQALSLRWRIENASEVIAELMTGLNESLEVTLEAPDGNYAVNVDVIDGDSAIPRSGVAVALYAATATPTPIPTATATPSPTPTATTAPQPVAAAPQDSNPVGNAPAAAPGAGSISVGDFEYGGHVTSTGSDRAASAMQRAGMSWMKVQVRYGAGMTPSAVSGSINNAHSRGFKVLIAVVGSPSELGSGVTGYMDQFASFLGGVAGQGPDAIEVWNEPNLDREWPRGQISGATYADLLRRAYQAIKGANGAVMVISGAPAPTGAEAAFPGQVVNDDNWIRQMIDAGGLQYMDCLGAHYNEGIVGPSQRSGDPRDGYYTRYFYGMLDTYWNLIGGQKPICFTELGYLTSAGYPPLPDFFAWAQNVSLQQHAAWLAEAAALASQSGRVRLMIVWNVDFTAYGSDPQAGYAMIRADGSCPACDAMAAAR